MTVSYISHVATASVFGCFLKLLLRWRGSIYKLIWKDVIAFLLVYYALNLCYRTLLDAEQQKTFQDVAHYCRSYGSLIPLSFVLGFYVTTVMSRWWDQYATIPEPDSVAIAVGAYLCGRDDRSRIMRRTIMRYVCLTLTVVLSLMAPRVKRRFPDRNYLREAGLLLDHEKQVMDDLDELYPNMSKTWLPIVWASNIVTRARKEGRIRDDFAMKSIVDVLNDFRSQCSVLLSYDIINVPLVYTQVVTIAVYTYFACQLVGHQWTVEDPHNFIDRYFPVFLMLQFLFYMGWLKVAESMINPFGDDDDDFEVNWMVDRNLQVSYLIVDEMFQEHPRLYKDVHFDEVLPTELPYRGDAVPDSVPVHSTAHIKRPKTTLKKQQTRGPALSIKDIINGTLRRNSSTLIDGEFESKPNPKSHYETSELALDSELQQEPQQRNAARPERTNRRQADLED